MSGFKNFIVHSEKITQTIIHEEKQKMSSNKPISTHHHNNHNNNNNHNHNHNHNHHNHQHNNQHNHHQHNHPTKSNNKNYNHNGDCKNKNKFVSGGKDKNSPVEISLQNDKVDLKNIVLNLPYNQYGWTIEIKND